MNKLSTIKKTAGKSFEDEDNYNPLRTHYKIKTKY